MKITKRNNEDIHLEEAHGGSGSRKIYASQDHVKSGHFDAMTHGFLKSGKSFDWHNHTGTEEIMVTVAGTGLVFDEDGQYGYSPGDVFIFPSDVEHKITAHVDSEMIFVRIVL